MKLLFVIYMLLYSSLCFSDEVKLYLVSYLNNDTGAFDFEDNWNGGTFLLQLGIRLDIDNAKAIYIKDVNANNFSCQRPASYHQIIYLRTATVFNRGNLYVMVARPCSDKNNNVNLRLVVLDKNKKKYTDTLTFNFDSTYDVN